MGGEASAAEPAVDGETLVTNETLIDLARGRKLVVVLDGVDELVSSPAEYSQFFKLLGESVASLSAIGQELDVVATLRLELLWGMDSGSASQLLTSLYNSLGESSGWSSYFLLLDLFDSSRVRSYIFRRLGWESDERLDELFRLISGDPDFIETLRRPLLLSVFLEMYETESTQQELFKMLRGGRTSAGSLLDMYVKRAQLRALARQKILGVASGWDNRKLAVYSVKRFRAAKADLVVSQFGEEEIVVGVDGGRTADPFTSLTKCPFLLRVSEDKMIFSHRVFLEFFVAWGVSIRVEEKEGKIEDVPEFNELVLNVDMRRFLRHKIDTSEKVVVVSPGEGRSKFHEITRFSYGLESRSEWSWCPDDGADWRSLDDIRITLLDAMTFPESPDRQVEYREEIERYLALEPDDLIEGRSPFDMASDLHPKYVMYCYESIVTYLSHQYPLDEIQSGILEKLRKRTVSRIETLVEFLDSVEPLDENAADGPQAKAYLLLLERLVEISWRMRFGLSARHLDRIEAAFKRLEGVDENSAARAEEVLGELRHRFLPEWPQAQDPDRG